MSNILNVNIKKVETYDIVLHYNYGILLLLYV